MDKEYQHKDAVGVPIKVGQAVAYRKGKYFSVATVGKICEKSIGLGTFQARQTKSYTQHYTGQTKYYTIPASFDTYVSPSDCAVLIWGGKGDVDFDTFKAIAEMSNG